MLQVGSLPFLDYQLWFLSKSGITEVVLCVGYLSEIIEARYGVGAPYGLRVLFSRELRPAGTGGALALAHSHLDETFFVLNGDTILDMELSTLAALLAENPFALGAVALRHVPDAGRYGRILLDGNRINGFSEKSMGGPGLINGGIYCLRISALNSLPLPPCSLEKDLFPSLATNRQLLGKPCDGYFMDIGLPETLARADQELPAWMNTRNARFAS